MVMFKIGMGICVCHGLKRLIVVKKGYCKIGNDEIKKEKRSKRLEGSVGGTKSIQSNVERYSKERKAFKGNSIRRIPKTAKHDKQSSENTSFGSSSSKTKQFNRTGNRRPTKLQKVRKPTGELILFKEIYEERGPYSQISGEYVEFNVWCFSHILPKGNYSRFRLDKRNIIIKTPQEHYAWHTETHKLKLLPEWKWVFELYEQLKIEYNERKHNNI